MGRWIRRYYAERLLLTCLVASEGGTKTAVGVNRRLGGSNEHKRTARLHRERAAKLQGELSKKPYSMFLSTVGKIPPLR
jgi:hypothetical protein